MNLDLEYRIKLKKLGFSLRERFLSQVKDVESSAEVFSSEYYLRSKLTIKYDLDKKYTPWIASEIFFQLNNPKVKVIDNIRYSLGFDYKFNKINSITLFYLINKEVNVKDPLTGYISGVNHSNSF